MRICEQQGPDGRGCLSNVAASKYSIFLRVTPINSQVHHIGLEWNPFGLSLPSLYKVNGNRLPVESHAATSQTLL